MVKEKRIEIKTDFDLLTYINNKTYANEWELRTTQDNNIQNILNKTSKNNTKNIGYPDLIYVNQSKKLLILIENKASTKDHSSKQGDSPKSYAVDGIKHYLSYFTKNSLNEEKSDTKKRYLEHWKIIGIAFSGDINDQYNHMLDTFIVKDNYIENINEKNILNEDDYISYFENIDLEKIANDISKSSKRINNLLRNIDSQDKPVLLSALMICMYPNEKASDFRNNYQNYQSHEIIISNILTTVKLVLQKEGIDDSKINILINELSFIKSDQILQSIDILKETLKELEENVIPLFGKKTTYDIIGKFYEEFLRYAGVANVKKGIVLTPNHISNLFTKIIQLKEDDVVFDPCCGSGAFLITGMNRLVDIISNSSVSNKSTKINSIKEKQLIGFENSNTMYSLAISNMLFRGDGKSQIFNVDFFKNESLENLKNKKPTIGFMNPPFGGKDNSANPTKKEIQFLERMLDNVSRYGVIIAPISTYFKEDVVRNRILSKHTLKCVINMPFDLFQPNASTITSIAVFKTNLPHRSKEVVFYDLKEDGLVLSKHKGRTDKYNKWSKIEKNLLEKIENPDKYIDNYNLVKCKIENHDEWLLQAHSQTDYSHLKEKCFTTSLKKHVIFSLKSKLNLLNKDIDEISLMEILYDNLNKNPLIESKFKLDTQEFKTFNYGGTQGIFEIKGGYYNKKPEHTIEGNIPFIGASKENNGITEYYSLADIENNHKDTKGKSHEISKKLFEGNCITVANNGSAGSAFYQENEFTCSHDVNVLYLKDKQINVYIAIFLVTLIELEKFRWNFGRKWRPIRMPNSIIKLPVDKQGQPDWKFMEDYIKSLPYSSNL